jgi:hypothetical protein
MHMGVDEGSLHEMPFPRELRDLLEAARERMQRDSWEKVPPAALEHAAHLLLDGMLRKFCTDVVGPVATGNYGRPMPDRFDLPVVLLRCLKHARLNCPWCTPS